MNLRPDPRPLRLHIAGEYAVVESNPILEDYLQRINAPLVRFISYDRRVDFIEQARAHLEQEIAMEMDLGVPFNKATYDAIKKYGDPETLADEFLESSYESLSRTPLTKRFGKANLTAYGCFQTAIVLYLFVIQVRVFFPSDAKYRIPWSPAAVREIWPNPLPFPDFTPQFFMIVGYPLLAPIVAGWIAGRMIPVKAARAVYHAMMPLCLFTFMMGAVLLPSTECLLFGLFLVVFWLPVGCLSAHISSSLLRRSARLAPDWEADGPRPPAQNI